MAQSKKTEVELSLWMIDLRPIMSVGMEPFMGPRPPVPSRLDVQLTDSEGHTLRMLMDGYESNGTSCPNGSDAIRFLLRALRAGYARAIVA